MIKLGDTGIGKLYLGSTEIEKAYLGTGASFVKGGVGGNAYRANYLINGSPTITSGTILTPASPRGFIYTPEAFNPGSSSWSIETSVRLNSFMDYRDVFSTVKADGTRVYNIAAQCTHSSSSNTRMDLYMSNNGTSWNKLGGTKYVGIGVKNTWRDLRLTRSGNTYELSIRARGGSWASNGAFSVSSMTFGYPIAFGGGFANNAIDGDIDLEYTKIYIGGSLWWEAVTQV